MEEGRLGGCLAPFLGGCNIAYYATKNLLNEPHIVGSQVCITAELRHEAKVAWREVRSQFPRRMFTEEFRDGFVDGYVDYLDRGGNASVPAVPPSRYTKHKKYFTPEGHCRLKDYFLGFKYGMDVAIATGQRQFLTVPVLLPETNTNPPAFNTPHTPVGPVIPTDPALAPGASGISVPANPLATPRPVLGSGSPAPVIPWSNPTTAPSTPTTPGTAAAPMPKPAGPIAIPQPPALPPSTIPGEGTKFGTASGAVGPDPALPDADSKLPAQFPPIPLPAGSPNTRPDLLIKLPEPPPEVPTLPESVPTPSVLDELPMVPPNHSVPELPPVKPSEPERK